MRKQHRNRQKESENKTANTKQIQRKKKKKMQNKLPTDMPKTQNLVYYLSVSKTKPHSKGYKEEKKK